MGLLLRGSRWPMCLRTLTRRDRPMCPALIWAQVKRFIDQDGSRPLSACILFGYWIKTKDFRSVLVDIARSGRVSSQFSRGLQCSQLRGNRHGGGSHASETLHRPRPHPPSLRVHLVWILDKNPRFSIRARRPERGAHQCQPTKGHKPRSSRPKRRPAAKASFVECSSCGL